MRDLSRKLVRPNVPRATRRVVHTIHSGRVECTIRLQEHAANQGKWFSVIFHRTDGSGKKPLRDSFHGNDLLVIAELLRKAWEWIAANKAELGVADEVCG